jgi:TnpA family transposase
MCVEPLIQELFDEKGDLYYSLRESGRSIRTCYLLSYAKENDSKFNIKDLYDLEDAESTKLLNNIHKMGLLKPNLSNHH